MFVNMAPTLVVPTESLRTLNAGRTAMHMRSVAVMLKSQAKNVHSMCAAVRLDSVAWSQNFAEKNAKAIANSQAAGSPAAMFRKESLVTTNPGNTMLSVQEWGSTTSLLMHLLTSILPSVTYLQEISMLSRWIMQIQNCFPTSQH
jgi:hypothetical protein